MAHLVLGTLPGWGKPGREEPPVGAPHFVTGLVHLAVLGVVLLAASGTLWSDEKPGYDDTPMLPNSPWRVHDRDRPQALVVEPGRTNCSPPSDAIVLFDGNGLEHWIAEKSDAEVGEVINILRTGGLRTKQTFGDCQLHIEWATPAEPDGNNMQWGNSGVFFHGLYELQIIESKASHIYADGNAGAMYGQTPPLVNPSRKPGEWQTFDVVFFAPRYDGDRLTEPARITAFWNGVLVQHNQEILGATQHKALPHYDGRTTEGPITLQAHGSNVLFRNIWIRPIERAK